MYPNFNAFLTQLKPRLDHTYQCCVETLLNDVALRDFPSFRAAMDAGKKIRGSMLCLVHESLGGGDGSALQRAAAVELIHAATLIHDDFVDQDTVRRGRPATWTLEGARKAVLLGDFIFASAIQMMSELDRESGLLISHAITQVAKGACHEQLEPASLIRLIESGRLNGETYQKIISLKTGILFAVACRLGAVAAGAADELKEKAYRYGMLIGEAYQLADDLKEVRKHMASGAINPGQMMLLAPLFSCFVHEMQPCLIPLLREGSPAFSLQLLDLFQKAEQRLVFRIEKLLDTAAFQIAGSFGNPQYSHLLQHTPRDLIGMFNASE